MGGYGPYDRANQRGENEIERRQWEEEAKAGFFWVYPDETLAKAVARERKSRTGLVGAWRLFMWLWETSRGIVGKRVVLLWLAWRHGEEKPMAVWHVERWVKWCTDLLTCQFWSEGSRAFGVLVTAGNNYFLKYF